MTEPAPGVRQQVAHLATVRRSEQTIDALGGGEVGLQRVDLGARGPKLVGRPLDLRLIGHDDEVEPFVDAAAGELAPDAGKLQ